LQLIHQGDQTRIINVDPTRRSVCDYEWYGQGTYDGVALDAAAMFGEYEGRNSSSGVVQKRKQRQYQSRDRIVIVNGVRQPLLTS